MPDGTEGDVIHTPIRESTNVGTDCQPIADATTGQDHRDINDILPAFIDRIEADTKKKYIDSLKEIKKLIDRHVCQECPECWRAREALYIVEELLREEGPIEVPSGNRP